MTSTQSQHLQEQRDTKGSCRPTLSTLWVPLEATIEQWAYFGKEASTPAALVATGTVFYALSWEKTALRHYAKACQKRQRGNRRVRRVAQWLERTEQDLDCAIGQWQRALSWLELACNDQGPNELSSQQTMRDLLDQANLHQERRRALHRQVLDEYAKRKQIKRTLLTPPHAAQRERQVGACSPLNYWG